MPDVPDYMQGVRRKRAVYRANGYQAVFIYPWNLKEPDWPERVLQNICSHAARRA